MKTKDVIGEFMPCEVCGNSDIRKFHFRVVVYQGPQTYMKCLECYEEYYSTSARKEITKIEDKRRKQKKLKPKPMKGTFLTSLPPF